jgi:hypothetical protein
MSLTKIAKVLNRSGHVPQKNRIDSIIVPVAVHAGFVDAYSGKQSLCHHLGR